MRVKTATISGLPPAKITRQEQSPRNDPLKRWSVSLVWGPVNGRRKMGVLQARVFDVASTILSDLKPIKVRVGEKRGEAYLVTLDETIGFYTYAVSATLKGTGPLALVR